MRLASLFAIAATASAALFATGPASAAPWDGPPGSYKQSCNNIDTQNGDLTARCRENDGDYRYTELNNYRDCEGDIWNDNGRLRCRREDNNGPWPGNGNNDGPWGGNNNGNGWVPQGSYRSTCRHEDVDGGTLKAECRDNFGRWRYTELNNFRGCDGDIRNDNGQLRCRRNDQNFGGITLYERSDYHGDARTFREDVPNLWNRGFADQATSLRLSGGRWQLCTKTNYQGRCVIVNYDVRDLRSLNMNDRIESIRRVR